MHLVSIVMPVYNSENYLFDSISSVLAQTYGNFELLVVNDGSKDKSLEIINSFKDERIKCFSIENCGQSKASNYGLKKASGDFIKFMDSDDIINDTFLENLIRTAGNEQKAIIGSAWQPLYDQKVELVNEFKISEENMTPLEWLNNNLSGKYDMMPVWFWLIPRSILSEAGGWNESLSLNNDFEYSIRLLSKAKRVLINNKAITYYRMDNLNSLSKSTTKEKFIDAIRSAEMGCDILLSMEDLSLIHI